ncbi:hypothetical protein CL653_02840 [bacterium]|nr:hypothetical protein [bacterium]
MDLSDEEIVVLIQNGETEMVGVLIDRYEEKLKRYGRRFLSDSDDVEDIVQEAFVRAYTNMKSFDANRKFSPWLYRITHNLLVNKIRSKSRYIPFNFDTDTIWPYLQSDNSADSEAIQSELQNQMSVHLNELDTKYKEPLILFYYESMSYEEISEILRIPVTTVGVRIKRAKDKLKKIIS